MIFLEEMRNEVAAEAKAENAVNTALKMLERGRDTLGEIAEMTDLPLEEVRELAKKEIA